MRTIGKVLVLVYFLVIFLQMLNQSKVWELKLIHVFSQVSIGYNKLFGINFPMTGKAFALYTDSILKSTGTVGLISVFSGFYGQKAGLWIVLTCSLVLNVIAYLPISVSGYKDLTSELIHALQLIAANSGLLFIVD